MIKKYVIVNLHSDMGFPNIIPFELQRLNEEKRDVNFIITSNSL